ncbi:MAG: phage major capsid protein [Clostridia bacterium]|nr:phage major capsid protein [Clostridia bacterium]
MKRKDILTKKLARLNAKKSSLTSRAMASQDVNEVRSINAELEDVNAEIEETQSEIDAIDAEENEAAQRAAQVPDGAQLVNGSIVGAFAQGSQPATGGENRENVDPTSTMEYRQAFMKYVQTGEPITRAGEAISTNETGAAIPFTIMNDVINTVRKRYGNLYSKVRKIAVQGGVEYPVGALSATFKWINEKTVSPRQSLDKLGKVTFNYHTAEIRISQTFLSQLLTLSSFEAKIVEVIAIAYLEAMDYGIVNGSGNGSMLGILNDPRVTNTITMTAAQISDWTKWRKNFFAALPLGYRSGEFIFPVGTVDAYLETMADANNNPIFRQATGLEVNDGDARNPNGRFFGRDISLVEPDIIADFDSAQAGDVIGIYWQPDEYAINENFGFTMRRYFDEETNEWVDKALVVVDGKILNPTGYYKIIKG